MYKAFRPWTVGAMDGAATKGRLDIVRRLYLTRDEGCSTLAFIGAASNNHVEVLRLLYMFYESKSDPVEELTVAARNGHLEAVYFRLPGMMENELAIEAAIVNGHVAVVEALLPRTGNKRNIFIIAAANNQVLVLRLLLENYGFYYSRDVLLIAAGLGHVRIMELVVEACSQREIHKALYIAAKHGIPV
ncbi:LOW QUALITY PROTEIN: Hypothetical protein PHPALM_3555 [Phytophthora palmivora]|uniref:Ankyrin repeat-containing domain n=1 Tax=Phytophthora palmivora TaxID=4796 RepID=A0A2P4YM43_9STRA|nr:LOW QUALITY PROTEIN: Hypothetical protein PHPALM_3555 [Phytophthora palmivora]